METIKPEFKATLSGSLSETTKICRACKKEKEIILFCKRKKSKDGFDTLCKTCKAEQSRANYDSEKEKNRYHENKERHSNRRREYRKSNSAFIVQKIKEWRVCNPEKTKILRNNYNKTESAKASKRKHQNRCIEECSDSYVKGSLVGRRGIKRKDIPQTLVDLVRQKILLERAIKQVEQNEKR